MTETLSLISLLEDTEKWHVKERVRLIAAHLDLLQNCLSGSIYEDPPLLASGAKIFDSNLREHGWDWPSVAHTMIGEKRLANVRMLAESVIGLGVAGDFIETGVWRGGACILMRGVLEAWGDTTRSVWLADSFEGLPPPNVEKYPADEGDTFHTFSELSVSLEQVKSNFQKYGLLDERVKFLKGWFKDTLPIAPIHKIAILRLDGDMYESTMDALTALYDKVSDGGYIIVDDYHVVAGCKKAIHDFLSERNLIPELIEIDGVGVYWEKKATEISTPSEVNQNIQKRSLKVIFESYQHKLHQNEQEIQALSKTKQVSEQEIQALSKAKQVSEQEIQALSKAKHVSEQEIQALSKAKEDRDIEARIIFKTAIEYECNITQLKDELEKTYNSTSWKITMPFRRFKKIFSKI